MGTSKNTETVSRPRSLADDLRARTDSQLEVLFSTRPDLLHPVPTDLGQLAVRATTSPSVGAALDALNHIELSVCEALAGLPDPSSVEDVHAGLKGAHGYESGAIDAAIDRLLASAVVWGDHDELHLVRVARESFGAYPCGLAASFADSRRQVREYATKKTLAVKTLATGPQDVREIMDQLLWGTPAGSMRQANRSVRIEDAKSPLEWLLAHELLVPTGESTVVVPREVSLALRNGLLLKEIKTDVGEPILGSVDFARVNDTGAHAALDFVRLVETLLEAWSIEPPSQLRGGGLAIRDLSAAKDLLRVSDHLTAMVIEIAFASGLLGSDSSEGWLPTTGYDRWLSIDDATRWTLLAETWRDMARAPHVVGGDGGDRINALTSSVERGFINPLRISLLDIFRGLGDGTTTSAEILTDHLDWHRPRRSSMVRAAAVSAVLAEAAALGITALGALTSFGRAVAQGDNPIKVLGSLLPDPVDHIIVQADLTALAPGRLPANQRRTMGVLADVESTGVATTYRFTETSIRRALDQGQSAHDIIDFLAALSRTPLPQPLTYMVEDVARKHGVLRVGVASIYLRCDDEQLIATVQADRRLASLKFRQLAPGIVVSSSPADIVLDKLRSCGYAPVAESAEGTVLIHRPDTKRTSAKAPASPVTVTGPSSRLVSAAVKALRAGERADANKPAPTNGPRTTTSQTLTLLNDALSHGKEVWIGYADKGGMTSERIVEPLTISGGFLTAFDVRTNEVRTFTIARITGADFAENVNDEGSA
ncbi:MAG: helicase-associated domain-containing protein [Actinomycetes bacterium]